MNIKVRKLNIDDLDTIRVIEKIGQERLERFEYIESAIKNGSAMGILSDDKIVGYYIYDDNIFFKRRFVSMLYIEEPYRGRGIGQFVVKKIVEDAEDPFFVSTNKSNKVMIHILKKCGFQESGEIYNLDHDDPELIFYIEPKFGS